MYDAVADVRYVGEQCLKGAENTAPGGSAQ